MTPRRPPPPPMPQLNKSSLQKSPTKDLQSQQAGGQSPARRPNKGKEKMKDTLKFPRLVNSFLSNSPLHPPKKRLVSLQRDFEPPVEGAVVPPSENIASSPLSSPIKSAARPFSSHWLSRPQSTEPLESPAHQEAMIEIEMDLPDMETGIDMNGPVEELADPEDFLSFEPLSPQDEVPTAKNRNLHTKISFSFAMSFCLMQPSQGHNQHYSFCSRANRRMSTLCETMWTLALQSSTL